MRVKCIISILIFLSFFLKINSQESYSLAKCIEYSLQHHASVNIYQNNIKIAKEQKREAISYYLPQISLNGTLTDNLKLQTTIIPAGMIGDKEVAMQFGKQYTTNIYHDISQTVYNQSEIYNIKAGKVNIEMSQLKYKQNNESLICNTAQAYFQVLAYKEYESKLHDIIKSYTQLSQILELKVQKGVALETDLERIKVSLKSAEYQLSEVETQLRNAIDSLKYIMGLNLDAELCISDSVNYEIYVSPPEVMALEVNSLIEYQINKTNLKLIDYSYKAQKAERLPSVNLFARIGRQVYSDDFSKSFSSWNDYSYVGISISKTLFDGFRRSSKTKENKLTLQNADLNLHLAETNYQLSFQNSEKSLLTAYNNLNGNKDNLNLAKKILDTSSLNYQKGSAPLSVFLNDDNTYKNAQLQYINSLFSYMSERLDYEKSRGTIFNFYNELKDNQNYRIK
ncbi:TolC family protein [uncultured Bacteroides sp.]|uniref:TolC family protein n=1 Tax=uncultured Bacteroides sp. TaxID=162156 RepID=UPI002AA89E40|nr:TolC family protein [uncultured Bacteroides sp.]